MEPSPPSSSQDVSPKVEKGVRWSSFVGVTRGRAGRIVLACLAGMLLLATVGGSLLFAAVTSGLPDVSKLDSYDPARTTKIFASDGTLIATLFDENRTYVTAEKISPLMVQSIVAIEDKRFYEHAGVDWKGIARAATGNLFAGGKEQGASTLTMQLARRLFLSDERTYSRKVREAVLASRIDSALTKEKIIELYLNEVYFGAGAYGIDSACSVYFAKDPHDLELWQAAMLAGLVQAPSTLSPLVDRKAALTRLSEVLNALEAQAKITSTAATQARKKAAAYSFVDRPLPTSDGMLKYPYFSTYVIRQLSGQFPEGYVRRGGLQVVTTLDVKLQKTAEDEIKRSVEGPGRALGADSGALVMLDNNTGDVVAMVGGPGWNSKKQFNAAWQSRRQPGSAFKMFVYAAALEAGYGPENEFADTEATFSPGSPEEWKPQNSDGKFMGAVPLRTGLQFSRNLVSAKLIAHVGPSRVASLAQRMGIEGELPAVASLALGAGEVSPLQMARAFSVLPSGGVLRPTHAIKKVTTSDGKVLWDAAEDSNVDRVLSKETARLMCEMLHRVVTGGTAPSANISSTYVAGKTGTTDNFKDAWFCGFTPFHTVAVWVGREDNKPMERVFGGTLPAEIFRTVAQAGLSGRDPASPLPGVSFGAPTRLKLCWDSTYPATSDCPKSYDEVFKAGVVASRVCPMHRKVSLPATFGAVSTVSHDLSLTPSATPSPALLELKEEDLPDRLNPRKDKEVVTSSGALIPYLEKPPSLKNVKFEVEQGVTNVASSSPTALPTESLPEESEQDPNYEFESREPQEEELPPLAQPGGSVPDGEGDPALSRRRSAQPGEQKDNEIIHQPEVELPRETSPVIPPDPVSDGA